MPQQPTGNTKDLLEILADRQPTVEDQLPFRLRASIAKPEDLATVATGDQMILPRASIMKPMPQVLGGPELARLVAKWIKFAPDTLQGRVGKVQVGPDLPAIDTLLKSKFSPYDYANTNLMGQTDMPTGNISLNPRLDKPEFWTGKMPLGELEDTLVHELAHARGYGGENVPEGAADKAHALRLELLKRPK